MRGDIFAVGDEAFSAMLRSSAKKVTLKEPLFEKSSIAKFHLIANEYLQVGDGKRDTGILGYSGIRKIPQLKRKTDFMTFRDFIVFSALLLRGPIFLLFWGACLPTGAEMD